MQPEVVNTQQATNYQSQVPVTKKSKQKLALVVAVVVLIAGAAYSVYFWQHKKVNSLNSNVTSLKKQVTNLNNQVSTLQAASKTSPVSQSPSSSTDTVATVKLSDAVKLVNGLYTDYIKNVGTLAATDTVLQKYGTSNIVFYSKYYQHGFDPIICAQDSPTSVKVTGNTSANGVATVSVQEVFGSGNLNISVNVVNQGGLKVDSLTCPGSLGNLPAPPANI